MEKRSFIGDILEQPLALKNAIAAYPGDDIEILRKKISSGIIQRIVMAGHGSSFNALYPSFLHLSKLPIPVTLWQTAELLKYGFRQIDVHTLLILNSQSGRSIEMEQLINKITGGRAACVVALTNYMDSPLGQKADFCIPLMAGEEHGVATKTFINPLALSIILSLQLIGENAEQSKASFLSLADEISAYLADWEKKVQSISQLIGNCNHVIVVGRGFSMASALNGAINQKEAAWNFSEGMNAAEFRHGPLELADDKLTLFIMEGDDQTGEINHKLADEVQSYGSHVVWIGNKGDKKFSSIAIPDSTAITQPASEAVTMQLVALALAVNKGLEAGKFRRIGKIVRVE